MNRIRTAAGHLRRAARYVRHSARALLRGPEEPINAPSTADWHTPASGHPSLLCHCGDVMRAHGKHRPECEWAKVMCRTCSGEGWCPECHGDGIGREAESAEAASRDAELAELRARVQDSEISGAEAAARHAEDLVELGRLAGIGRDLLAAAPNPGWQAVVNVLHAMSGGDPMPTGQLARNVMEAIERGERGS